MHPKLLKTLYIVCQIKKKKPAVNFIAWERDSEERTAGNTLALHVSDRKFRALLMVLRALS